MTEAPKVVTIVITTQTQASTHPHTDGYTGKEINTKLLSISFHALSRENFTMLRSTPSEICADCQLEGDESSDGRGKMVGGGEVVVLRPAKARQSIVLAECSVPASFASPAFSEIR